jgi:hypothetical protein
MKRQALQDELARMAASRADRGLDLQEAGLKFNQDRATKQDALMEQQRTATEANALADQIPPDVKLSAEDPAVSMMQKGGRGALLTGVDPTLGSRQMQGYSNLPGATEAGGATATESKPKPTGFLKTASQKQRDTEADNQRQSESAKATAASAAAAQARQAARDDEMARHNRVMENKPTGGGSKARVWVTRNGQVMRVSDDEIQPGDRPYSASQTSNGPDQKQANEVEDAIKLIDQIDTDPALNKSVGPLDAYGLGKLGGDVSGVNRFEALHNELVGKLQLAQAGKLKGQGQISDKEREMLRNAATALTRKMSETDYRAELKKVRAQFQRMQQPSVGTAGPSIGERRMINGQMGEWDGNGWKAVQ